jgi:RNA polymerase sigma-70 factor (ECF subfamily)
MEIVMYINDQTSKSYDKSEQIEYLMRRFGKNVIKIAYYHIRDIHIAEDICQEVFLRVYNSFHKFRGDSSYYTWIYRITVNLCKDYIKSAALRKILPFASVNDIERMHDDTNNLFESVEGGEIFNKVMKLPTKYRIVVSLYYFEGYSTKEIANMLKVNESNVRVRLHRGREKLKEVFNEEID